jgi:predicted lipoprotein with Yx(FWY)xxD motif
MLTLRDIQKELAMRYLLPVALATTLVGLTACNTTTSHTGIHSPATVLQGRLVGPQQMTLYIFDRDITGSGKSMCNDNCAKNWPPLLAPSNAKPIGAWNAITRDDGSKQWAYQGKPLYYWAQDSKPGDTSGDGVGGAWHVAKP